MKWKFKPHPSHKMSKKESLLGCLKGARTIRLLSVRRCLLCDYDQSESVSGKAHDEELEKPCEGVE